MTDLKPNQRDVEAAEEQARHVLPRFRSYEETQMIRGLLVEAELRGILSERKRAQVLVEALEWVWADIKLDRKADPIIGKCRESLDEYKKSIGEAHE